MSNVINRGNFPKALTPGIKAFVQMSYEKHKSHIPLMFSVADSKRKYEELVAGNSFGRAARKNEGANTVFQTESQAYVTRVQNISYALGFQVTKEEWEDNLYDELTKRRSERLARAFFETKEIVAANVFNRASNPLFTYGDGKSLITDDHPTLNGNQSNSISANLSEKALEDICIKIRTATDNTGNRIGLMPKRLMVAPQNKFEAARILKSEQQNDTANNAVNALKTMGCIPEMFDNPYFTNPNSWFVKTNLDGDDGLIMFDRTKLNITEGAGDDTQNYKWYGFERYSFTTADWRAVYGSAAV